MRPTYETASDSSREIEVAERFAKYSQATALRNKKYFPMDFTFTRGSNIVAFGECKVRTNPHRQYPDYMISMHKIMAADQINWGTGLPCFLIVQWSDALGYCRMESMSKDRLAWGGRKDRGDSQDMEPCYYYDIDRFKILERPL